ncbi:MAG: globin [Armatimonadota bacterium]|nr:globin [Armatimonadota bacterium]
MNETTHVEHDNQQRQPAQATTLFDAIGGAAAFERIVERFYTGVESDPILRPLYPADLAESKRHLTLFLIQYFGGPTTYSQERVHPRLLMRHLPFAIGQAERDAWMRHMAAAVEAENFPAAIRDALLGYFERTATFMMNQ